MNESERNNENTITPEMNERSRGEQFSIDLDNINATIEELLISDDTEPAQLKQAWAERAILAEQFVDSLENTADNPNRRERAQFDIMVDKAMIFEKVGNMLGYLKELDTAEGFAFNNYLDDVIDSIADEIDSKAGQLDNSIDAIIIKLRNHICFEDRELLRDMIYDGVEPKDVLDKIYDIILDEGRNPEEILRGLSPNI